jgi:hypothetical protein
MYADVTLCMMMLQGDGLDAGMYPAPHMTCMYPPPHMTGDGLDADLADTMDSRSLAQVSFSPRLGLFWPILGLFWLYRALAQVHASFGKILY